MLELKNLSLCYDGRYVIRNVNLTFEPGMIYTIVGKNGSGKSTRLKSWSGLLASNKYTIEWKSPAAYRSEAIITGFGSNSCRNR